MSARPAPASAAQTASAKVSSRSGASNRLTEPRPGRRLGLHHHHSTRNRAMMTISEAFQNWQDLLDESGNIDRDDGPAMAESWNDYVDALCKDGDLTELQHHCCPAWDDDMPAPEDELDFILRAMRVELTFSPIDARSPDSDDWPAGSRHFACTLTRG